jgi:predicted ABC-type ATPase
MPVLTIIAGCNGAGKSVFAPSFLPDDLISFDYDKLFLEYYNQLSDSELREEFARNKTTGIFEKSVDEAISNKVDFCYETNFDANPLYWAEIFKKKGYTTNLIFFCLENQDIAKHRIQVRTEFNGHYVNDYTLAFKWKAGYENLNAHYSFFDNILIVDNSKQGEVYTNLLQIKKGKLIVMTDRLPDYFSRRFPDIYQSILK